MRLRRSLSLTFVASHFHFHSFLFASIKHVTYEQMCQFFTRRYYQFSSTFSEFSDVFVLNERCWGFVVVLGRQSPCISTDG